MRSYFSIIFVCLVLSACSRAEWDARQAVLDSLKDPDSAKFGDFTLVGERSACMTVNAKNSMGGYTGDQQATLIKSGDAWEVISIEEQSHADCVQFLKTLALKDEE